MCVRVNQYGYDRLTRGSTYWLFILRDLWMHNDLNEWKCCWNPKWWWQRNVKCKENGTWFGYRLTAPKTTRISLPCISEFETACSFFFFRMRDTAYGGCSSSLCVCVTHPVKIVSISVHFRFSNFFFFFHFFPLFSISNASRQKKRKENKRKQKKRDEQKKRKKRKVADRIKQPSASDTIKWNWCFSSYQYGIVWRCIV